MSAKLEVQNPESGIFEEFLNDPNAKDHEAATMDTMMEAPAVEMGQDTEAKTETHLHLAHTWRRTTKQPAPGETFVAKWPITDKGSQYQAETRLRSAAPRMLGRRMGHKCEGMNSRLSVALNNLHFEEGDHTPLKELSVHYNCHPVHKHNLEKSWLTFLASAVTFLHPHWRGVTGQGS